MFIPDVAKLILAEMEGLKSMLNFTGMRHNPGELSVAGRSGQNTCSAHSHAGRNPVGMAGDSLAIARLFLLGNGNLLHVVLGGCLAS